MGTYEIVVIANSDEPKYQDMAKFFINSIEFGKANKTQLNTKITFTRDLLSSNPECLELSELLTEAELSINSREYTKASQLIDDVIDNCRYLISAKTALEETPKKRRFSIELSQRNLLLFGGGIAFLAIVASLIFLLRKPKAKSRKS